MKHGLAKLWSFMAKQNEAVTKAPLIGWGPGPVKGPGSLGVLEKINAIFHLL